MFRKIVAVWVSVAMLAGFVVIISEIAPVTEASTTIYVDDEPGEGLGNPPENYSTIQAAINAANNGDTIFVYNGTYYEGLSIYKVVNITGENRNTTIIDGGGGGGEVIHVQNDWVNISGFTIMNRTNGIFIDFAANVSIVDNIISANRHGMFVENSQHVILRDTDFTDVGVFIYGYGLSHFITHNFSVNNSVQGKPLLFYKNQINRIIDGIPVGQIILVNCSNFTIKDLEFNNTNVCMEIAYTKDTYITSNIIQNTVKYGIYVFRSSNNTLKSNNFTNTKDTFIRLKYSSNNIVTDNICMISDMYGITMVNSQNNTIKNNVISMIDRQGLGLTSLSSNNILEGNIISDCDPGMQIVASSDGNTIDGNEIFSNTEGIFLGTSLYNKVLNNNISNNDFGIRFQTVGLNADNNIIGNSIWNNANGIYLTSAGGNRIYHNNLMNNPNQAYDDLNNTWDNGYPGGGNYWSDFDETSEGAYDDYTGPKQDILGYDGIVDNGTIAGGGKNPYAIDANSQDTYPLIEPYIPKPLDNITILKQGWNLVSLPLIQQEQNLTKVLASIDGLYDAVQWYDITDVKDHWKHHKVGKPYGNDLFEINEKMGFWIHITPPGDTIFLYNGTQPSSNQTIALHKGWNLVGYPALSNKMRDEALNNLTFYIELDAIWMFNATTQAWEAMGSLDYFELGRGYWVHATTDCQWDVPL